MDTLNDDEDYKEASGVEWIKTETVSLIIILNVLNLAEILSLKY